MRVELEIPVLFECGKCDSKLEIEYHRETKSYWITPCHECLEDAKYDAIKDFEKEIEFLNNKIKDLKSKIEDLKNEGT